MDQVVPARVEGTLDELSFLNGGIRNREPIRDICGDYISTYEV